MREECKRFDTCSAPLCPRDRESLEQGIWYPDEKVCKSKEFQNLPWIKRQKKVAKATRYFSCYWTFEMLKADIIIRQGIKGLNPDRPEPNQLKRWFKAHPPISSSTREKWREHARVTFKK